MRLQAVATDKALWEGCRHCFLHTERRHLPVQAVEGLEGEELTFLTSQSHLVVMMNYLAADRLCFFVSLCNVQEFITLPDAFFLEVDLEQNVLVERSSTSPLSILRAAAGKEIELHRLIKVCDSLTTTTPHPPRHSSSCSHVMRKHTALAMR